MANAYADRIRQFRLRAEEVRTVAEAMQDIEARRTLFGVAENYERLADSLEKLSKPRDKHEDAAG